MNIGWWLIIGGVVIDVILLFAYALTHKRHVVPEPRMVAGATKSKNGTRA